MDDKNNDFLFDEESEEVVRRYEQSVNDRRMPYFDVDELEVIADYYLSCGKTKESWKVIDLGLKLHPNNATLQTKRAKVYLESGEARKAFQILERNTMPDDAESLLLKGDALMRLHRNKEATSVFQHLTELPDVEMDGACLDIAYIYIGNNDYQQALSYLEKGLMASPKNLDLLQESAFCCEQLQQEDKAMAFYEQIIAINPYSVEAWFDLGLLFFNKAMYEKALDAFDFVTVIDEEDTGGWLQKGNALFHLNRFSEALVCYHHCEEEIAFEDILFVFMAECYEKMEEFDKAELFYSKAVAVNNQNVEGWIGLGICALETEDYDGSILHFNKALAIEPENHEIWVYLAEAFINKNEPDEAMNAYQKALALESYQPDTWLSIGNLYLDLGLYNEALASYTEALSQDSTLENIHLFLAITHYKMGNEALALIMLAIAREIKPDANSLFLEICPEANPLFSKN
jgi:tetratricopeptide (TPR) repeat protein